VNGFSIQGSLIVLTGSEDTFLKVNLYKDKKLTPMQTFANHVASIRSITKLRLSPKYSQTHEYLVMSAGSRMQAQLYRATFSTEKDFTMNHICQFMKSFD
jgi:hypothetical protein